MGLRSSRLRTKVVALLVTLTGLWAFGAWVTLRDGLNLLWVQTLEARVYAPTEPLVLHLQEERRLTLAQLGSPQPSAPDQLAEARRAVDTDVAHFRERAQSWWAEFAARPELERRVAESLTTLDALAGLRAAVDNRSVDRTTAAETFSDNIDTIYRIYGSLGNLDAGDIDRRVENLIRFSKARELASQTDGLLAGAYAADRLTAAEHARVVQLIGMRRMLAADAMAELPRADQDRYRQSVAQGPTAQLQAVEDRLIAGGRPGGRPAVPAEQWRATIDPALAELQRIQIAGGDEVVRAATPGAIGTIVRMLIAAGLGLIAVVISVNTARSLVRQLEQLRLAALRLANDRLPGLVARLGRGESVDVDAEAPPIEAGRDEIGQVAQAFNVAQSTAVRTAVEQAELRRSVRDIFLSLARRTQALLHRQLTLLDAMERRENEPDELEDLFRVDHLATRMRRNAENLIVLSGAAPGRAWRRNVPMIDVLRGAAAEVEDYTRVTVLPAGPVELAGRAVGDVIHLLAELIENALSFSPPHTAVQVSGQLVANGYAVEIEDRGLGMSADDRAAANDRIASEYEFSLAGAAQLGLYVVSRLSERHGVKVRLKESPYGGTTAVVLIPPNLVSDRPGGGPAEVSGESPAIRQYAGAAGATRAIGGPEPAGTVAPAGPPGGIGAAAGAGGIGSGGVGSGGGLRRSPGPGDPGRAPVGDEAPGGWREPPRVPRQERRHLPEQDPRTDPGRYPDRGLGAAAPGGPATPAGTATGGADLSTGTASAPPSAADVAPRRPAAPPAGGVGPASGLGQPAATAGPDAGSTPSGLPIRVRQANLAPALRNSEQQVDPDPVEEDGPRSPEEIRRMMSSYQSGTRRGRSEAARPPDDGAPPH
ncbi:nitrate- and nitrite sensing domain-containing protein [Plantactinospora sp. B24E8]|uniref:sensor histidine kinase n=1 Tax=Plantactinospora sp. B24E8 TaxID=3153567 RepID=UPI00325E8F2E